MSKFKLKLKRLDFVSLVDEPAQQNAKTLLIKRHGRDAHMDGVARYVKAADELGLAFFWAFTSTNPDGTDHYDLHGDAVAADTAMIKAAMDYMLQGGAVDEMHDSEARDGARVAFAFPMTPEIAKAFGIETKQSGLMVALKVTSDQLAKLKDGTYTGVSIAGLGIRQPVQARKRADKRYLTDEVLGHQHEVTIYDGSDGNAWMTDATAEGAQAPHRHTVIRDTEGQLVVLADSGHTHTLTEAPLVIVAPDDATVVSESVAARAPRNSTRSSKSVTVGLNKETTVDELAELKALKEKLEARIAELEAQLVEAQANAELNDEEKEHIASLSASEAKWFRSLDKAARQVELEKAREANPVVAVIDGVTYRKNSPGAVLAKRLAEQEAEVEKAKIREIAKSTLGSLAGDEAVHCSIVKAIRKSGESAEMVEKMLATLKGANAVMAAKGVAPGFDGASAVDGRGADPYQALEKGLRAFCAENKIEKVWTVGLEKFKGTPTGSTLYSTYLASRNG